HGGAVTAAPWLHGAARNRPLEFRLRLSGRLGREGMCTLHAGATIAQNGEERPPIHRLAAVAPTRPDVPRSPFAPRATERGRRLICPHAAAPVLPQNPWALSPRLHGWAVSFASYWPRGCASRRWPHCRAAMTRAGRVAPPDVVFHR